MSGKKRLNDVQVYKCQRFKEDTVLSFEHVRDKFGVEWDKLRNSKLTFGFNTEIHEEFVNVLLANGWNLVSVSEDDKSITYHFVSYL